MSRAPAPSTRRALATAAGLLAVAALVGIPVELSISLVDHPVIAPSPFASVLLLGSCLLLVRSGLELRRREAARSAARPPVSGL
jgi:hypothetical protein